MEAAEAVARYIRDTRQTLRRQLRFYAQQPSLKATILAAARSQREGKREKHQCRIPSHVLARAGTRLCRHMHRIEGARSFESLHREIEYLLTSPERKIRGVGPLTVYDLALRIGERRRLKPKIVYLHAGARVGARRLNVDNWKAFSIRKSELPPEFDALSAAECENCLCIYFAKKKVSKRPSRC